ncbi:hypothetical protein CS063_07415 [Sporanaerobium hydrogeniformans]|uniref:Uncharacterized protein n=1 Tax=Sporanaerobium hydrogeniformans TaxID=3072179 RepID=A0AC61DE50_9FIRM|nr:hypothetical protein [Sporanaerobium hydrogeniformans]PHV71150.1 hypothetical protein CS063_07415 [Sporanaerobium hydrogeniformans]
MKYEIKYKKKENIEFESLRIIFNGISFRINKCDLDTESYDVIEYLPGIYIKIYEKYPEFILSEIYNKISTCDTLIKKTILLIKFIRYRRLIEKMQETTILLEVKNMRDDVVIFENRKLLFENKKPYQDPINEKYMSTTNDISQGYDKFEYVDTSKIMYPIQSGGWGNRCIMKQIFGDLNLFHTYNDTYKFFEENEMHYTISQIKYLKNVCSRTGLCKTLLEKFTTNTYISSPENNWSDDITLKEKNGVYKILNGNHRVCCAKIFEIPYVKARVYKQPTCEKIEEHSLDDMKDNYQPITVRRPLNLCLTQDYYNILLKLGINRNHASEILEKGLRGKALIDYIEKTTGKNLLDLYREVNKK